MKKIALTLFVFAIMLGIFGVIAIKIWAQPYYNFTYSSIPNFNYSSQYQQMLDQQLTSISTDLNLQKNNKEKIELKLKKLLPVVPFPATSDGIKLAAAKIVKKDSVDVITNVLTIENDPEGQAYLYRSIAIGSLEATSNIKKHRQLTYIQPSYGGNYARYYNSVDCLGITFIPDFVGQEPISHYECEAKVRQNKENNLIEIKSLYFELENLNIQRMRLLQAQMKISSHSEVSDIWVFNFNETMQCESKKTTDLTSDLAQENVFSTEAECNNAFAIWKNFAKKSQNIKMYENGYFILVILFAAILLLIAVVCWFVRSKKENPSKKGLDNKY